MSRVMWSCVSVLLYTSLSRSVYKLLCVADTNRMEAPTSEERGSRAKVSLVKLDVVGPLLPSPQTPRCPPAFVVENSSLVVVLSDLHTHHTALRANWGKNRHTHTPCWNVNLYYYIRSRLQYSVMCRNNQQVRENKVMYSYFNTF